jgi:hypothetical protein
MEYCAWHLLGGYKLLVDEKEYYWEKRKNGDAKTAVEMDWRCRELRKKRQDGGTSPDSSLDVVEMVEMKILMMRLRGEANTYFISLYDIVHKHYCVRRISFH